MKLNNKMADKIVDIIKSNIEKETDITMETTLDELEIDSFGTLILINAFEQEFDISIKDEEFEEIRNVKDIVTKLQRLDKKNV